MTKEEFTSKIQEMYYDTNYYINSGKGNKEQKIAWQYARELLDIVLKMANGIEN
jgi:hypothetical protein